MSELARRVVSALVLGPPVLLLVWWGNPGFAALAAAVAAVIVWEWNAISRARRNDAPMYLAATAAALAVLAAALGQWLLAAAVVVLGAVAAQLAARSSGDRLLWLGVLYAAVPTAALVMLRDDPEWGRLAVFWLLFVVWATDIGALFAGRLIGGPKLWPAVSPKKTWAGAVGGIAVALAVGAVVLQLALPQLSAPWTLFGIIVCLSVAAQLGDIAESALKRHFGVKDASDLIPGHGGVMDRVDGLVAAALLAGIVGALRAGPEAAGGGVLLW